LTSQSKRIDESTTGKHIPALDGIRGAAIASVLMVHLFVRNSRPAGSLPVRAVTAVMASGWVGVALFFVLSGFLITGILYDTLGTPRFFRNFYARRALRIFPLYYGFILLMVLVSSVAGYHWYLPGLLGYLTYTMNLHSAAYTNAPWVNLNHFWSLAIEEQFYMAWPAMVFLLKTRRRIAGFAVAGTVFSIAVRLYFWQSGALQHDPYLQYSFTPSCLDGLFAGALLALLIRSRFREQALAWGPRIAVAMGVFWVGMLVRGGALPAIGDPLFGTCAPTLLALTFAGVVASVLRAGSVASRVFAVWPLRQLGTYSYGLYIYHYSIHNLIDGPIWSFVSDRTASKVLPIVASGTISLALSLVIAVASFHWFERPILRLKNRFPANGGEPKLRRELEMANHG
jgi:peptidoglycan/LPS O-acetylase OafA/YrhL